MQTSQPTNVVTCPLCGYPYPMTDLQREVYRGRNMGCMNCGRPFRVDPPVPAPQPATASPDGASPEISAGADDSIAPALSQTSAASTGAATSSPATPAAPKPRRNPPAAASFVCAVLFFVFIAAATVCSAIASDADPTGPAGGWAPHTPAGVLTALAIGSAALAVLLAAVGLVRTRHIAGPYGAVRTAGRGLAVAGLVLGGGGLLLTLILLSTVMPLVNRQHELAHRELCKTNLQAISVALAGYVDQNGGRYPDSLDALVASGSLPPGELVCPSTTDAPAPGPTAAAEAAALSQPGHQSYRYAARGLTRAAPPDAVLVYEPPANHGEVGHVLFRDGLILPAVSSQVEQLKRELDTGQNPGPTAPLLHQ